MFALRNSVFLLIFLLTAIPPAIAQLRMHSPYDQDRINPELTRFTLHDSNGAEFEWTSEWTEMTAQSCTDEAAIFIWHFKDGTKAYSRQGDLVTDFGKNQAYKLSQKSSDLEDENHNRIQPLTKTNFPIKIELWVGTTGEATGYSPKARIDYLCLETKEIEADRTYHFTDCP